MEAQVVRNAPTKRSVKRIRKITMVLPRCEPFKIWATITCESKGSLQMANMGPTVIRPPTRSKSAMIHSLRRQKKNKKMPRRKSSSVCKRVEKAWYALSRRKIERPTNFQKYARKSPCMLRLRSKSNEDEYKQWFSRHLSMIPLLSSIATLRLNPITMPFQRKSKYAKASVLAATEAVAPQLK